MPEGSSRNALRDHAPGWHPGTGQAERVHPVEGATHVEGERRGPYFDSFALNSRAMRCPSARCSGVRSFSISSIPFRASSFPWATASKYHWYY